MHFGENQLSRSLIGLSPLPTAHPPGFQPRWVRSSTRSYTRLNLAMGRSPRFGSIPRHSQPPCSDSLSLRLPLPGLTSRHGNDSQAHSSIGTPPPPTPHKARREALTACRRPVSGTLSLPSRGTFHHSLTVLIRYRSSGSIQATKWSWQTHTGSTSPVLQRENALHAHNQVPPTGLSPTPARHPRRFSYPATHAPHPGRDENRRTPTTPPPQPLPGHHTTTV